MQAHYPFTAEDVRCQITQIYSAAPRYASFPHPTHKIWVFYPLCFTTRTTMQPPLVFVRLKEVRKLMETPPRNVVVYFTSEIMQMERAAKARYDGKYCFSCSLSLWGSIKGTGLENYPNLSEVLCSLSSVFAVFE